MAIRDIPNQVIRACPVCGEPNGRCHGQEPVPMRKWQAADLAITQAMAALLNLR